MKRTILILGVLVGLVVAAPANASVNLDGWWPFYEGSGATARDTSGNHDDGALSGGVQWTGGYFGPAITFDGKTGRVYVPNRPSLEPASQISVAAYVKATSPGAFKYIVSKGASGCIASSYALYTGASGGLRFYISQNNGNSYTVSPDAGTGVWDGKWHFVVGTYDGSAVHMYVDGTQVGTGTPVTGPIGYGLTNGNDLFFGHYDGCAGLDYPGSVDEPTVWSQAWSPTQVSLSYRALAALHGWVSRLPSFPGS